MVYKEVLASDEANFQRALARACRQTRSEVLPIFYVTHCLDLQDHCHDLKRVLSASPCFTGPIRNVRICIDKS